VALPECIRHTLLIGIDLGPNLSVTTPPALLISTLALFASQNHPVR
jgi:hypothetical protein